MTNRGHTPCVFGKVSEPAVLRDVQRDAGGLVWSFNIDEDASIFNKEWGVPRISPGAAGGAPGAAVESVTEMPFGNIFFLLRNAKLAFPKMKMTLPEFLAPNRQDVKRIFQEHGEFNLARVPEMESGDSLAIGFCTALKSSGSDLLIKPITIRLDGVEHTITHM